DGRPETDHVLGDAHPEQLGGNQVPDLVQRDRHRQAHADDHDPQREQRHAHRADSWTIRVRAAARAQSSTARTPSTPAEAAGRGRAGSSRTADSRPTMAGKVVSSTGSKVQLWAVEKSRAAASPGSFSGWASAQPIAWRMSGGLAWAMVEPSIRVAIEWTMDCGWTTTSTRCSGRSNRKQ